jgi:hypothetical protein
MFGIFIFGTKPIEKLKRTGFFHCPACRRDTPCSHLKVRQFFTAYFIPLFPVGSGREVVRCDHCMTDFPADILQGRYDEVRAEYVPWECRHCGNTNPSEYTRCVSCNKTRER